MQSNPNDRPLDLLIVVLIVLLIGVPIVMLTAMALTGSWDHSGFDMMGWSGGGIGLFMIAPIGIIIAVVIIILVAMSDRPSSTGGVVPYQAQSYPPYPPVPQSSSDSLAILDRRLASGEVSIEEYNRIKTELLKR
jgi:uncharacterized membrane protein